MLLLKKPLLQVCMYEIFKEQIKNSEGDKMGTLMIAISISHPILAFFSLGVGLMVPSTLEL